MESFWGGQEKMAKSKVRVNQCLGKGLSRKHRKKNKESVGKEKNSI